MKRLYIIFALMLMASCGARGGNQPAMGQDEPATTTVKTGLEVLVESDFAPLQGKRVGLVTNPSGVDRNLVSTVDILANAPGVNLVALYGPPRDPATGLPVYSLYGSTRKPTPEMLKDIDVMVYDIQDNGCRSYTFISTLGLVMSACAEAGIEVVVLDRPNPLGGLQVDGPLVEDGYFSFVGMYRMNRGQRGTDKFRKCHLTVVEMEGWRRDMLFQETGLPWVMPSPHIPQASSAQAYPCSGIAGDMGSYLNIGVGYTLPFETFAAEWIDNPEKLAERLNGLELPGVRFRPIYYKPFYGGAAGKLLKGVQFYFTNYHIAPTALLQFYVIQEVHAMYPKRNPMAGSTESSKYVGLDKIMGGSRVRELFSKRYRVDDILDYWNKDREAYLELAREYYRD